MQEILLPHYNERQAPIDMLVLHSTAHNTCEEVAAALNRLELSAHYILGTDGTLCRCIPEDKRAWHAGVSSWRGITSDINSHSIGIEICSPSLGQEPFTEAQMEKLIPFCQKLIRKYKLDKRNIVAHSDIAPTRKPDPGKAFPWKRLAKENIGLWYQPRNAEKMPENNVEKLLSIIGYNTTDEENTIASAYAFRRRFLPEEIPTDDDVHHLVDNVYPCENKDMLCGEKFLKTLKAVAYSYQNA